MIARDILSPRYDAKTAVALPTVESDATVFDVLPRLLESPEHRLAVASQGVTMGVIDSDSLLEGMARMTSARDDASEIVVECLPHDYSASLLAHAVEDVDAHLLDMLSAPTADGNIRVTLRVRMRDPEAAIRSLERYDFRVVDAHGIGEEYPAVLEERLAALQTILNI